MTTGRHDRLDQIGSLLIACGLISLLLGFSWGGTTYPWESWQEVLLFAIGLGLAALAPARDGPAEDGARDVAGSGPGGDARDGGSVLATRVS